MSKIIFKASKYLSDSEENAEMYLTDIDTRSWVDYCDGKEVRMVTFMVGKIPSGKGYNIFVHIDWCEVLDDVEI
jgi:hypothetical protein|nr:MAG TPA: hypothetical protein [Caudoviricetes sp.]